MTCAHLILKKDARRKDYYIPRGPTKGVNPPKDLTKGVDLKGRTMARKDIRNHEHCFKNKGKVTLLSGQLTMTSFMQEPEDKVDSIARTRNQDE